MMYSSQIAQKCRSCDSTDLVIALSLKDMPPGDKYSSSLSEVATLSLSSNIQLCKQCGHIQMAGYTNPEYIYGSYLSRPASTNPALLQSYSQYATELVELADRGYILEVGSNDGLFLDLISKANGRAIGIEPAENLVRFAEQRGVRTVHGFANDSTTQAVLETMGARPTVILANHSFSNVIDIHEWLRSLSSCLDDDGHLVLQTFYQLDVLRKHMLENYNHEHLSYMTVANSTHLFSRYGLQLAKVRHLEAKGGSIRFYFKKTASSVRLDEDSVQIIENERAELGDIDSLFEDTKTYITQKCQAFQTLFENTPNATVAAYGTSIGATVFSYQFGLQDYIKAFFDDDELRQGTFSPGTGAPVLPGRSATMNEYSHIIILAPLYADAIIKNNLSYLRSGGTFIKFWPDFETLTVNDISRFS